VILLTGCLGGATAIQLSTGNLFFGELLFPIYVAVILWERISLRGGQLDTLVPLRG
jgi:hypothetical protein